MEDGRPIEIRQEEHLAVLIRRLWKMPGVPWCKRGLKCCAWDAHDLTYPLVFLFMESHVS